MAARQQSSSDLSVTLADLTITEVKVTEKELGRGADATVIEVRWKGGFYAGKQLHDFHVKDSNYVRSFAAECKRWSELDHSKIVKFFGVHFRPDLSIPMLILEKMDTTLWKYLQSRDKKRFPLTSKVYVLRQAGEALAYLHSLSPSLIHCDLSPNNILLNQNTLETKVTDFGMSRAVDTSKLTSKSSVKGTQAFIAPEAQLVPPKYDEKRDVFSYGNVIVTMITHDWPHPGPPTRYNDDDELIACTEFQRRQIHLDKFTAQEKEFFLPIIEKCLHNRPKKRPTSREVMNEIRIKEEAIKVSVSQVDQPVHLTDTPPDSSGHMTDSSSTPPSSSGTSASHVTHPTHSTSSSHVTDPSYREIAVGDFQSQLFMGRYQGRFLEVVNAHAIRMKLEIDEVIPRKLSFDMANTFEGDATKMLYLHLRDNATSNVIHKVCDAMTKEIGYPKMNQLGSKMKSDKDLPPYVEASKVQQQANTKTDNSPTTVAGVKRLHEPTGSDLYMKPKAAKAFSPMSDSRCRSLNKLLPDLEAKLIVDNIKSHLHIDTGGFLNEVEIIEVFSGHSRVEHVRSLFSVLKTKDNATFGSFCLILSKSGYGHWSKALMEEAGLDHNYKGTPQLEKAEVNAILCTKHRKMFKPTFLRRSFNKCRDVLRSILEHLPSEDFKRFMLNFNDSLKLTKKNARLEQSDMESALNVLTTLSLQEMYTQFDLEVFDVMAECLSEGPSKKFTDVLDNYKDNVLRPFLEKTVSELARDAEVVSTHDDRKKQLSLAFVVPDDATFGTLMKAKRYLEEEMEIHKVSNMRFDFNCITVLFDIACPPGDIEELAKRFLSDKHLHEMKKLNVTDVFLLSHWAVVVADGSICYFDEVTIPPDIVPIKEVPMRTGMDMEESKKLSAFQTQDKFPIIMIRCYVYCTRAWAGHSSNTELIGWFEN